MKRLVAAVFAVALATSALADGAATYAAKCKACHGAAGEGTKMAPEAIKGKDATEAIAKGKGKMKAVKLEDADAKAVVDFVKGLK